MGGSTAGSAVVKLRVGRYLLRHRGALGRLHRLLRHRDQPCWLCDAVWLAITELYREDEAG
jgi:hypothetical protein